jgi:hypothetical protein
MRWRPAFVVASAACDQLVEVEQHDGPAGEVLELRVAEPAAVARLDRALPGRRGADAAR